jgi:4-hydroxybenzoate polyprenyltransferase
VGGVAAVFAVTPHPSFSFLILLFFWLFFWEIGGQNTPNDWADMKEDTDLQAETIPVRFGAEISSRIIVYSLCLAVVLSVGLYWITPARLNSIYVAGALLSGFFLLLVPAYQLHTTRAAHLAASLFNRASYYPLAMLLVILASSVI